MESPASRPGHGLSLSTLVALVAMPLFFVSNLIIGRDAVGIVPPWSLAFWRWSLASLMLLPFAGAALYEHRDLLRAQWRSLALLGFLAMILCGGLVYVALLYTTATNATLIYTTSTIMIVVMDAVLARRPLPALQVAGAAAGFLGIAVITLQGDVQRLLHLSFNIGDLGIMAAAISWAAYSLLLRKGPLTRIGTLPAFTAIAIVGAVELLPFMLWEVARGAPVPQGLAGWGPILVLAFVPSVLAFGLFQYCVRVAGASVTALFLYLLPPYGVILAVVFLGEQLHPYHGVGLALILGGVVLATRPAPG
ncbi:MAG TPA: DMT family transporter [Xanthobacteraceae bacterium]|nr:DMT family transporter [Xanthobacteraceae bacterium]